MLYTCMSVVFTVHRTAALPFACNARSALLPHNAPVVTCHSVRWQQTCPAVLRFSVVSMEILACGNTGIAHPPGMGLLGNAAPEPTGTSYNWFTAYPKVRGCRLYSRVAFGLKDDRWDRESSLRDHTSTWMSWQMPCDARIALWCLLCWVNEKGQRLGTSWHSGLLAWATKTWKGPFFSCRGLWDFYPLSPAAFYTVLFSARGRDTGSLSHLSGHVGSAHAPLLTSFDLRTEFTCFFFLFTTKWKQSLHAKGCRVALHTNNLKMKGYQLTSPLTEYCGHHDRHFHFILGIFDVISEYINTKSL